MASSSADGTECPPGERFANLELAFSVAIHSLLTACSDQEFKSRFSFLKPYQQDVLYKLYMQMVVAVQENVEAEFADICQDARIMDALDDLDRVALNHEKDNEDIQQRIKSALKKETINSKSNELKYLKQTFEKVKEQNHASALKLKALRESLRRSDSTVSGNEVLGKLKDLNFKSMSMNSK